jgi:hypothetical protein
MTTIVELNMFDLDVVIGALEMLAEYQEDNAGVNEDDGDDDMATDLREEERDTRRIIGYLQTVAQNRLASSHPNFSNN